MGTYVESSDVKENHIRVSTRVRTRKLDRSVAHNRMKKAGIKGANKHGYFSTYGRKTREDSYFSTHWHEVADEEMNNM